MSARTIDYATNGDGDAGRFAMLREWEADADPPDAHFPRVPQNAHVAGRWCALCSCYQPMQGFACPECGEPFAQEAA